MPSTALAVLTASGLATGPTGFLAAAGVLGVLALVTLLYVRREKLREERSSGS
jgi:hypothetical protein